MVPVYLTQPYEEIKMPRDTINSNKAAVEERIQQLIESKVNEAISRGYEPFGILFTYNAKKGQAIGQSMFKYENFSKICLWHTYVAGL